MTTCHVCLIEHDPAIHQATLDVHAWFRRLVTLGVDPPPVGNPGNTAAKAKRTPEQERLVRAGLGIRPKLPPSY